MQPGNNICRQWRNTVKHTAYSALLMVLAVPMAEAALYRWVDSNGRVQYSDTLPATYQKSGASELNKQGLVIKRTQSESERSAEAARREEEAKSREIQQKQAQIDRALTATYTTEAEIDLARDRALEHHKLAIKSAEARNKAVVANLTEIKQRIASRVKSGRKPPPNLLAEQNQIEQESLELQRLILKNETAMVTVREKYAADKSRFRELYSVPTGKN